MRSEEKTNLVKNALYNLLGIRNTPIEGDLVSEVIEHIQDSKASHERYIARKVTSTTVDTSALYDFSLKVPPLLNGNAIAKDPKPIVLKLNLLELAILTNNIELFDAILDHAINVEGLLEEKSTKFNLQKIRWFAAYAGNIHAINKLDMLGIKDSTVFIPGFNEHVPTDVFIAMTQKNYNLLRLLIIKNYKSIDNKPIVPNNYKAIYPNEIPNQKPIEIALYNIADIETKAIMQAAAAVMSAFMAKDKKKMARYLNQALEHDADLVNLFLDNQFNQTRRKFPLNESSKKKLSVRISTSQSQEAITTSSSTISQSDVSIDNEQILKLLDLIKLFYALCHNLMRTDEDFYQNFETNIIKVLKETAADSNNPFFSSEQDKDDYLSETPIPPMISTRYVSSDDEGEYEDDDNSSSDDKESSKKQKAKQGTALPTLKSGSSSHQIVTSEQHSDKNVVLTKVSTAVSQTQVNTGKTTEVQEVKLTQVTGTMYNNRGNSLNNVDNAPVITTSDQQQQGTTTGAANDSVQSVASGTSTTPPKKVI